MTVSHHTAEAQAAAEQAIAATHAADRLAQAHGMTVTGAGPGRCAVHMTVTSDMTNAYGTCHGGILFSLADCAFAFACNSQHQPTVAASAEIEFLAAAHAGDELTATATETWRGGRSGIYDIVVTNQAAKRIALFRGRSHRLSAPPVKPGDAG